MAIWNAPIRLSSMTLVTLIFVTLIFRDVLQGVSSRPPLPARFR